MIDKLFEYLNEASTPYHAVTLAKDYLVENGFTELFENQSWSLKKGGKYFTQRDGSALIAFKIGEDYSFIISASHTDSPCLKLKLNAESVSGGCTKLNVERYGGGLNYSFLDTPLSVAGRAVVKTKNGVRPALVKLNEKFVIPSLAIHLNRNANDGLKLNAQIDMQPLSSLGDEKLLTSAIEEKAGGQVVDYDLFLTPTQTPFYAGFRGDFASAPRVDNLASAYASLLAIKNCNCACIPVIFLADNEEVGSRTKQGAGSAFLKDTLKRISLCLNKTEEEHSLALAKSFMLSCDNSHAIHPNHPELSDPTNKNTLGGGVVIKHHANQNYTTDAMSSAVVKYIFDNAGVKYQDFFIKSDMACGGTLGAISSSQVSIRSADIGMPQLAMHSAVETFATCDFKEYYNAITAVLSSSFECSTDGAITIK